VRRRRGVRRGIGREERIGGQVMPQLEQSREESGVLGEAAAVLFLSGLFALLLPEGDLVEEQIEESVGLGKGWVPFQKRFDQDAVTALPAPGLLGTHQGSQFPRLQPRELGMGLTAAGCLGHR
jgi:hypothetical protein